MCAYKTKAPLPIAEGGTNTTSITNTNGTLYYNGTNVASVNPSTAGFVLTSNGAGSAPSFQANPGTGIALILIQTQTNAGGASLIFIPTTTYNNYLVFFTNATVNLAASTYLMVQISTDGGVSYATANYVTTPGITNGLALCSCPSAAQPTYGTAQLFNTIGASSAGNISSYSGFTIAGGGAATQYGSDYNLGIGAPANAFQFLMSSGANWAGTISLYGYNQ